MDFQGFLFSGFSIGGFSSFLWVLLIVVGFLVGGFIYFILPTPKETLYGFLLITVGQPTSE